MNYLALDTSGENLTVVLCFNDKIYKRFDKDCGVNHSVAVMPAIEELVNSANADLSEMDFFACVVGPGSFTGIRIGVSTVKALCFAYNKPCLSVTSFDTVAYNKTIGKVMAIIDAKHGNLYACGYEDGKVTYSPRFMTYKELENFSGYSFLSGGKTETETEQVDISEGLILAVQGKTAEINEDANSLVPLYIRKSQAEEGR